MVTGGRIENVVLKTDQIKIRQLFSISDSTEIFNQLFNDGATDIFKNAGIKPEFVEHVRRHVVENKPKLVELIATLGSDANEELKVGLQFIEEHISFYPRNRPRDQKILRAALLRLAHLLV